MNQKARTQAWDAVMIKAALHAASSPPSASTHARALECYGGAACATKRLERQNEHPAAKVLFAFLVLAGIVLLLAIAGCVAPEAIEQARTEAAVAHGHALDGMLPVEARMIGADEERAWRAQHRALTGGDDVPGAETWAPLPSELAPATPGGGR